MSRVRKSVALIFAENYSSLIIQFISTLILARLLTPAQIGIFSVAAVVVSLAHTIRDFGVGQYVIQEDELTPERIRAAFGLAIATAWIVAVLLYIISEPFARFYAEPGVADVMHLLVINFLLLPFSTVSLALWRREMNFMPPYIIKTCGTLAHACTAITLAYLGFGYMSMAWAAVASIATISVLSSILRPSNMPWLPGIKEYRRVLSFGSMVSTSVVIKELGAGAPDLIVGRALGMGSVGIFGRGMGLVQLFERYISSAAKGVVLPHFATVHREGGALKAGYLQALGMITGLAWPFYGFLALMAYPIIRILYGTQWDAAIPLVGILALYGAVNVLFYFGDNTLLALGKAKNNMQIEFIRQPITVGLILIGCSFGLEQVAIALVVSSVIGSLVSHHFLRRHIGLKWHDVGSAIRKSLLLSLICLSGPVIVIATMDIGPDNLIPPFIYSTLSFGIGWLIGIPILKHPLHDELQRALNKFRSVINNRFKPI